MSNTRYVEISRREIPDVEFHQNTYARELARLVAPHIRWLDVGAGMRLHNGYGVPTPTELASACAETIGLDFEENHLRNNTDLSSYVVGGGDEMPFPDGRFNLVSANMVLEHLENPVRVFREASRVLEDNGRFVFITPNANHPLFRIVSLLLPPQMQRMITHRLEGRPLEHIFPTFYRANTVRDISALAAQTGFTIERLDVVRNIPFITKPALGTWMECQFIKLTKYAPLSAMGADIVGVLRKTSA